MNLPIRWLNCKNKTRNESTPQKTMRQKTGKNTQHENFLWRKQNLCLTLTLVQPYQSEVAETHVLEWFLGAEHQRKVIFYYVGITKQHGVSGTKQLVLSIWCLCYRCFSLLALESQGLHRCLHRWVTICGCDLHLWEQDNKTQPQLHRNLVWWISSEFYEQKVRGGLCFIW